MEHLPLVAVRPAGVRPSVIPGDGEDGEGAVVNLRRDGRQARGRVSGRRRRPMRGDRRDGAVIQVVRETPTRRATGGETRAKLASAVGNKRSLLEICPMTKRKEKKNLLSLRQRRSLSHATLY